MDEKVSAEIIASLENSNFYRFLGISILRLERGLCDLSVSTTNIHDKNGNICTGAYSSIFDFASRLACYTVLTPNVVPEMLDANLSVCIPCNCQAITVHTEVVQSNEYLCFTNSNIYDENDELVATGKNILRLSQVSRFDIYY